MDIEASWITDNDSVPPEFTEVVDRLRAFLSSDDIVAEAAALSDQSPSVLLPLIDVLLTAKDATRLTAIKTAGPSKVVRKACGKAIHRLKAQGVSVSESAARVGSLTYVKEDLSSYLGTPLAMGLRMVILSGRCDGAVTSCYAVLHESEGVDQLMAVKDPSRSRLRKIIREIESQPNGEIPVRFVECPPELARQRIQQSIAVHRAKGRALPTDYSHIKPLIDGDGLIHGHPVFAELGALDEQLIARSAELLGHRTSDGYKHGPADRSLLTRDLQLEIHQRLTNATESPIILDDVQRRERIQLELEHIVRDLFHVEHRALCAERLLDTAFVLAKTGQVEVASIAAVTARALHSENANPLEIPWACQSIYGLVDVDRVAQGLPPEEHVHGPDFNHGQVHAQEHGHVHGPGCDHG